MLEVAKFLRVSAPVVRSLIDAGALPHIVAINPLNRCPIVVVDHMEAQRFWETFITLQQATTVVDVEMRTLRKALQDAGVAPAFDRRVVEATYYRRADLLRWMPSADDREDLLEPRFGGLFL